MNFNVAQARFNRYHFQKKTKIWVSAMSSYAIGHVLTRLAFISNYLKEESRNDASRMTKINKEDFIPEKIKQFETVFKTGTYKYINSQIYASTQRSLNRIPGKPGIENLKQAKRQELDAAILQLAEKLFQFRNQAFQNNTPYLELEILFPPSFNLDCKMTLDDLENVKKETREEGASYSNKWLVKKHKKEADAQRIDIHTFIKSLEKSNLQLAQIKWYIDISQTLKKSINTLNETDLMRFVNGVEKHFTAMKKNAADRVFKELMAKDVANTKAFSGKKGRKKQSFTKSNKESHNNDSNKSEKEEKSEPSKQIIVVLNDAACTTSFKVHPRIKRWSTRELSRIQKFNDFDKQKQCYVRRYENYTNEELLNMRACHNFSGIERILSNEFSSKRYTFPYQFEEKEGRGLYCTKIIDSKEETGLIHLGIGEDKIIYHAFFSPLKAAFFPPEALAKDDECVSDKYDGADWELVFPYSFSMLEDDIVMEIGEKPSERVAFRFHSLTD